MTRSTRKLWSCRTYICFDLAAEGRKWVGVVVVGTPEVRVRGHGGAHAGGVKEIESVLSLWE